MITCSFENGDQVNLRHVTVGAIVIKEDKVLLCKRGTFNGKPILESGKWALLGGFFDRDETLVEAAKREVMEESGWEIDDLILLRINDNPNRPKEDRQNMDMIFIAKATRKVGSHDEEVRETQWFDLDKVPKKDEWAFDHYDSFSLYMKHLTQELDLPVLG